jgi:DNA-3-methyladenine glycosylase II
MNFEQQLRKAEKYLAKNDKVLAPIIRASGPCRIRPHTDHYGELVSSIVGQQLSAKAGAVIWGRVLDLFGSKMPTPKQLIQVDPDEVRACGVSYPKISYMKDLAQHVIDKRLDLEHISTMPNEQLIELPDPATCVTVANENKWHPYESVATWYLWQSLDNSPQKQTRHNV